MRRQLNRNHYHPVVFSKFFIIQNEKWTRRQYGPLDEDENQKKEPEVRPWNKEMKRRQETG